MRYSILLACLLSASAFAFKDHPLDEALIKYESTFEHYVPSLADAQRTEVKDLLRAQHLTLLKAPNPSALMHKMHAANLKKEASWGTRLRVLSYNVALLNAKILQVISVIKSPYNRERVRLLPQLIFEQDFDVILLQELWGEHRATFEKAAAAYGYESFYGRDRAYEDGLATFVKKRYLADRASIHVRWSPYEEQDPIEYFPGAGVKRGFLHLQFTNDELGIVHVYNTHLQSFRKYWRKRNYQARELGLDVLAHVEQDAIALVGGDLNAAPYFRNDVWVKTNGSRSKSWWKNTIAYAALLYYGGLDDAMVMGAPADQATIDVTLADNVDQAQLNCEIPHLSFTATDCNSLNLLQYGGLEPPSRQDHLLIRDQNHRVKILSRGLMFTEKIDFGNKLMIEPSDHYAVFIDAQISK
jgi:endonuclease/exonuclease/phosphatase family metal-dependent hydrolase